MLPSPNAGKSCWTMSTHGLCSCQQNKNVSHHLCSNGRPLNSREYAHHTSADSESAWRCWHDARRRGQSSPLIPKRPFSLSDSALDCGRKHRKRIGDSPRIVTSICMCMLAAIWQRKGMAWGDSTLDICKTTKALKTPGPRHCRNFCRAKTSGHLLATPLVANSFSSSRSDVMQYTH